MTKNNELLDLRGLTCPEPVIRARHKLDNPETATIEALVDDDVCVNNLKRLASSLKAAVSVTANHGYFTVTISKDASPQSDKPALPQEAPEAAAQAASGAGTVIFLAKDTLGQGDQDFSQTLLNVFLQTAFQSGQRPQAILLMNTGVRLMAKDSQVRTLLDDFQKAGSSVLACGLCLDYYKLKDDVPVEQITNMYAISEYLFAANKIIQP